MKESRVKRIFKALEKDVDLIILKNAVAPHVDLSFFYATGLTTGLFEGTYAFLYPDGKLEVLTSPLEEESAKKGKFKLTVWRNREKLQKMIKKKLRGIRRIGLNNEELTHRDFLNIRKNTTGARFFDVSEPVKMARAIKDEEELAYLREACRITSRMADRLPGILGKGVVETEAAAEMAYQMQKMGAGGLAFSTIVGSGPNSAEPHYTAGERKLRNGDIVVCDFGARYMMYCADITRTYIIGKPSKRQRDMYQFVSELQETALDLARAGEEGKKVQEAVEKTVARSRYKGKFTHGVGHGLGLACHDGIGFTYPPNLVLKENMVLTVEPGVYLPGWGGVRIEDDIVIRKGKCEILTDAKKRLEECII